jgi:Flp pilus assembly protein TadD, contains TPR repeats
MSDESENPSHEAEAGPPPADGESTPAESGRRKLPAGWLPKHGNPKAQAPVFVEEPPPPPAGNKRAWLLGLALVLVILAGASWVLFFRPASQPLPESPGSSAASPAPPSAEELRRLELHNLRSQLRSALNRREWEEIESHARRILEREPADGEAWHAMGWVFEKNRAWDEAAQAYGRAAEAGFLRPQVLLKRATMLRHLNRHKEALADLEESARLDPDTVVTSNLILICRIQAGHPEEVRTEVRNLEKIGLVGYSDRYLLGKAALELRDGDFSAAARSLSDFRARVPLPLFAALIQDSYFDPFRAEPALRPFLLLPE